MTDAFPRPPVLWFFGTGTFAASCLAHLVKKVHFDRIVTSPPSSGGRGMHTIPSPVEKLCENLHLDVFRSPKVSREPELLDRLAKSPPDCILVVDFGQKILEPFLSTPSWGCVNIHPSLLPFYRGAAPVQRALLNGDPVTGVTLFRLVEEMDAGPILFREEWPVGETESAGEVLEILAEKGSELYLLGVKCLIEGSCEFRNQDSESATYAPKIANKEAECSWVWSSHRFVSTVRAMNPSPGAFLFIGAKRMKVWEALHHPSTGRPGEVVDFLDGFPLVGTSDGSVALLCVQPEGKKRISGAEWARGIRLKKGDFLQ